MVRVHTWYLSRGVRLAPVPRVHIAQLLQIGCPHGPYLIPVHVVLARAHAFVHVSVFVMLVPLWVAQALEYHDVVSLASFSKTSSCGYIVV